jgi:hypothetical protein
LIPSLLDPIIRIQTDKNNSSKNFEDPKSGIYIHAIDLAAAGCKYDI